MKPLSILVSLFLISCSTPKAITESFPVQNTISEVIQYTQPSFDGNEQNSGIIDFIDGKGWLITPRAARRYNDLIKNKGNIFSPPIETGFGLSIETHPELRIFLSQEAMVKFAIMNQYNQL